MIKNVLFDLDGTLLPMKEKEFTKFYLTSLDEFVYKLGYDYKEFINNIIIGTELVVNNDGTKLNKEVFWNHLVSVYGLDILKLDNILDKYYDNEFNNGKLYCPANPISKDVIKLCLDKKYNIVLATNPIFPKIATYNRIKWAKLNPSDFLFITTYDNSYYSKPNIKYYEYILNKFNFDPNETLMVGNDVNEDMCITKLNVSTFLVTDYLKNISNLDISKFNKGNMSDLYNYLKELK
ncbi:MAG: HAD family hydrolase [Firmicutes bacterium]|uniref:HAD family hydrolase n=1 Tax=Candidatus Onthovivens merdipullorum TaxID=2840889 RepID=A0A9D9DGN4_9BACL|nr:HAD family hydrolase [Candidatus Onthovivens merdipullorum]